MGDFKSKLPDLKELGAMTKKLFTGISNSVTEIIDDYNKKRESEGTEEKSTKKTGVKSAEKNTEKPAKRSSKNNKETTTKS